MSDLAKRQKLSKFSLSSLRSRAIVLILLAIFPLLGLTLYSYFERREHDIRDVQKDELQMARNLATIQETVINDSRKLLATLAQLPQVQRRDRKACSDLFAELLKQSPQTASIVATDSEGRLFCGAPARPGPVNYADRRWFQKIIQTKDFVIDEAVVGRSSGKYGTILAYPILNGEGRFQGALATQSDLQWLGNLLAKSEFPPTTDMVLADSSWKVLFHYPEHQKYIGKTIPDSLVRAMTSSDEGVAAGEGFVGEARLFAFTRLSAPRKERLYIGAPLDWAVGPANRALGRNLIGLILLALFALASAWYGGNLFIMRPVEKLRAVTERLAAGDLTVRSGPDYIGGDLGLLSRSFDQMADSLQEREEDLRLANEKLQREVEVRQAAETAVEAERQRLYALLDTLPGIIYLMGEDHTVHFANQGFRQLFGNPEGQKCYEIVANLSSPCPGCPCLDILKTGIPTQSEWTFPAFPQRTFEFYKYPFHDYDGSDLVLGLAIDITEHKQAEDALRESEERFRAFMDNSPAIALAKDEAGRHVYHSKTFENRFGIQSADWRGKTDFELWPQEIAQEFRKNDLTVLKDGQAINVIEPAVNPDGRLSYWWTFKFLFSDSAGVRYVGGIGVDITEKKQAEEALRESEVRFRTIFEGAASGITLRDAQRRLIACNAAYQEMLGYNEEELKSKHLNGIIHPDDVKETQTLYEEMVSGKRERGQRETRYRHKNGKYFWARVTYSLVRGPQGEPLYTIGMVEDITGRKVAEENIHFLIHELMRTQEQERHKISLELHDTVAQELASLKIGLENLRDNPRSTTAEMISSQVPILLEKLSHSLNSIRTLSYNLRPPDLEHLGLVQAIQRHCEEIASHTGLHIDFKTAGIEAAHLDYDAAINLYRIVQEGLANVWRHARAENVSIRLVASYPKIILRLEDDGQGFEVAEKLALNPLDRRMGLLGMKERIAFLGGEMHLESQLKKGTKIKIEIPWSTETHGTKEKDSDS